MFHCVVQRIPNQWHQFRSLLTASGKLIQEYEQARP